ncbi:MAG: LysR family transcriptional regulator [Arenicella sp.]
MEIRWLEDFIVLARTRHFSRAANEQNVTQPTFSRRIKLLEEEVGVTLIDRNSLPLSLTPAGEIFLAAAKQIAHTARETKRRCQDIRNVQLNCLSFATTQSLYLSLYKSWLKPLSDDMGVTVELNLESTVWAMGDFVAALRQQQSDLMLCYWHAGIQGVDELDHEDFEYIHIDNEWMVPVSAVDDGVPLYTLPGSKRKPLPYIGYRENTFLGPLLNRFLRQHPKKTYMTTMNENMHAVSVQAMVREGFGVGWVLQRLADDNIHGKRLALIGDETWRLPLEIRLYRFKNNLNPNLTVFWDKIREASRRERGSI